MTLFREQPALLAAFRAGDRVALEAVYWRYVAGIERVLRFGFQLVQTDQRVPGAERSEVADMLQEVFARAFTERARLGFDGLREFGPYLAQIARNLLVDVARKRRRELSLDPYEAELDRLMASEAAESAPAEWAEPEVIALTQAYLAGLPDDLRGVHEQRFVLGRSQRGASSQLGLSRQQLRTKEAALLEGLRKALRKAPR
jgi:RNA polymerase sigma factor (sigma-70 family)